MVRLAHYVAGDKAGIELSVADSSPGVDEENLPHLFDRLYRVEKSRNRATGGAGIGLAICKNIAQDTWLSVARRTEFINYLFSHMILLVNEKLLLLYEQREAVLSNYSGKAAVDSVAIEDEIVKLKTILSQLNQAMGKLTGQSTKKTLYWLVPTLTSITMLSFIGILCIGIYEYKKRKDEEMVWGNDRWRELCGVAEPQKKPKTHGVKRLLHKILGGKREKRARRWEQLGGEESAPTTRPRSSDSSASRASATAAAVGEDSVPAPKIVIGNQGAEVAVWNACITSDGFKKGSYNGYTYGRDHARKNQSFDFDCAFDEYLGLHPAEQNTLDENFERGFIACYYLGYMEAYNVNPEGINQLYDQQYAEEYAEEYDEEYGEGYGEEYAAGGDEYGEEAG